NIPQTIRIAIASPCLQNRVNLREALSHRYLTPGFSLSSPTNNNNNNSSSSKNRAPGNSLPLLDKASTNWNNIKTNFSTSSSCSTNKRTHLDNSTINSNSFNNNNKVHNLVVLRRFPNTDHLHNTVVPLPHIDVAKVQG
ncbi:hypothetical protein BGX21_006741, partial [Mortierella sp. AD011]